MATLQIDLSSDNPIRVRALLLGSRIDTKPFRADETVAINPLSLAIPGGGCAILFRYGVVVFFSMNAEQETLFLERLLPLTGEPRTWPEDEKLNLRINANTLEGIDANGCLWLQDASIHRLQLVAEMLARSEVLSDDEARVAKTFDQIEPLAKNLSAGRSGQKMNVLLSYIGDSLLSQQRMVGRAEVADKPDLLWERPELEGLYLHLEDEFELRERHLALERKLQVISNTAETLLDLLHTRRSLRVEWYIVILIVVEIGLTLYEMFFQHR
ncbi:RMD1 family protein [Candidatus Thiothrix sp. Deng01]|uniref:RMD1 family protein n=1 Tax=Candidatus Thiothrix phosphatis TaxID=3112415 RepID=A0ABU6CZF4_9GAMM|nr:RMD1 family protein [Candidatus Thiothrix sp. Deng01]MEB4592225.1 RMD1 family protein [Candidatus Thiothrix sp. Deng01]